MADTIHIGNNVSRRNATDQYPRRNILGRECVERNGESLGRRATDVDVLRRRSTVSIWVTWPPVSRGGGEGGHGSTKTATRDREETVEKITCGLRIAVQRVAILEKSMREKPGRNT